MKKTTSDTLVQSPQRYELEGGSLAAISPPDRSESGNTPPPKRYFRRVRRAGVVEAHAINLPPNTAKPPSVRKEGLIVLVVSGQMETQVDGNPAHDCRPLSVTYHPAGQSGTGTVGPGGVEMLVLSLDEERCRALESEGLAAKRWRPIDSPLLPLKALREFAIGDEESTLAIEEITASLFAEAARRDSPGPRHPRWWNRLQECLADAEAPKGSLGQLAAEIGVHPVHLCTTYRAVEGRTLGEARRRERIERACQMILGSDWSLGEIGYELRYADQAHFIRAFRQTLGFCPSELRGCRTVCTSLTEKTRKP